MEKNIWENTDSLCSFVTESRVKPCTQQPFNYTSDKQGLEEKGKASVKRGIKESPMVKSTQRPLKLSVPGDLNDKLWKGQKFNS